MSVFPDLQVLMNGLETQGSRTIYRWTLIGTNDGPGGSGKRVQISGFEDWGIDEAGLIAESNGHFDEAEYQRQLATG